MSVRKRHIANVNAPSTIILTIMHIQKMPLQVSTSMKVAVIGGGPAGLAAAHELQKEGHEVVVFERGAQLGGCWVYSPDVESDLLGLDSTRKIVHSSLYASLRTNLPREVMGFRDYPFVPSGKADRDSRRFVTHQEVLRYLEDFARDFGLNELFRYETEVRHVRLEADGKWMVKYRRLGGDEGDEVDEAYDAVVVCNGHYTEPRIADNIPGIDLWPGRQIHSHNYRIPNSYQDQVVVIIGSSASALDICRDIAGLAKEVHIASRSEMVGRYGKHPVYDNMWLHQLIERAHEDGRISFEDGSAVHADVILHCTGYKYHYPFLPSNGVVTVDDNRVHPLYKHVFPPALAPGISFVGVPSFSKWISRILSGRISLPSEENMMKDIQLFYSQLEAKGVPKHDTHKIHDFKGLFAPFEYEDWLATECGCHLVEEWRKNMFYTTLCRVLKQTETYRDECDDEELVQQACKDFMQYLSADGKALVAGSAI